MAFAEGMMGQARAPVEVFADGDALIATVAEVFVANASAAIRASGRSIVALSGGSTPNALYDLLATDEYRLRVDWTRVEIFWGDERCVPPDDPASNYGAARDHLLARVSVPERRVHRIRGEDDPAAAAAAYESDLRGTFGASSGPPPTTPGSRFDLVLLGMGNDGHTASLFPGTAAVRESSRWVVAHQIAGMWRVSLTPVLFNAGAEVLFLVAGREKAAPARRVLEGAYEPDLLPAQVIAPRAGRLRWFLDAAAASELHPVGQSEVRS